jgi:O-antigen chain-terminating methyltransferase
MQRNSSSPANASVGTGLFPVNPDLGVDELMARVRSEVERRREAQAADAHAETTPVAATPGARLPRWLGFGRHLAVKPAYTLAEMLQFADEEFVATAYRVLLRRPPDAEGVGHYLAALRNGYLSKVQILGEIRFSAEGRKADVHVDGLMIPFKLHGLRRIPVVGRLIAFASALVHLPSLSRYLQSIESAAARANQDMGHLINRIDEAVEQRLDAMGEVLADKASLASARFQEARVEALEARLQALDARLQALDATTSNLSSEIAAIRLALEQGASGLHTTVAEVQSDVVALRRGLLDLQRKAVASIQDRAAMPADSQVTSALAPTASAQAERIFEAEYVSFEDAFRGARDDIKERAAEYLVTLASAGVVPETGRVVDLGCGRGEWLELLRDNGFQVTGVDMNASMLDECRQRGFDVAEADAVSYLAGLEDASLAAITAMHLVEHLPHDVMIRLVDEAQRVLKPGGILILETPNPENITVGSCWFYMDPTHRNPIPPPLLEWTVANRGFTDVEIRRLTKNRGTTGVEPWAVDAPGADGFNKLLEWFNAAPDYAVVGKKA